MLVISSPNPYSFDPLDHDALVHHMTQRPVLATLISQYRSGEIMGVLAKSWKISPDRRVWTFTLRSGMKFEDGTDITPNDIKRSFTRMAFFMNKKKSKSGLFELMEGYDKVESLTSNFTGISTTEKDVIFILTGAPDQFLEKLSFGLYSVVSEKDYDPRSGIWNDPKKVTSSGPYRLINWDSENKKIILGQRNDFLSEVFPNKKFKQVTFDWTAKNQNADIYLEDSSSDREKQGLKFEGNTKNGILYLRAHSWKVKTSPLHSIEARRLLRNRFYHHLSKSGYKVTKSFVPVEVTGVKEGLDSDPVTKLPLKGKIKICDNSSLGGWRSSAIKALQAASLDIGLEPELVPVDTLDLRTQADPDLPQYKFDLRIAGTGILVEQPLDDLKFMVESKQGIRLGDPFGSLRAITSKANFEPQELNKAIWHDAVSIPITHLFLGMWINPKRVDVSLIDLSQPPTELALIQPVE